MGRDAPLYSWVRCIVWDLATEHTGLTLVMTGCYEIAPKHSGMCRYDFCNWVICLHVHTCCAWPETTETPVQISLLTKHWKRIGVLIMSSTAGLNFWLPSTEQEAIFSSKKTVSL